jgi:hypothetical protein
MTRQCGDCQLCCKLLPVPPLQKAAGVACRFQKFHKGCRSTVAQGIRAVSCSTRFLRWTLRGWVAALVGVVGATAIPTPPPLTVR